MKLFLAVAGLLVALVRVGLAQPALTTSTADDFARRAVDATDARIVLLNRQLTLETGSPRRQTPADLRALAAGRKRRQAELLALERGEFVVPALPIPAKVGQAGTIGIPLGTVESVADDGTVRVAYKFIDTRAGGEQTGRLDFATSPIEDPQPGADVLLTDLLLVVALHGTLEQQVRGDAVPAVRVIQLDELLPLIKDKRLKKPYVGPRR